MKSMKSLFIIAVLLNIAGTIHCQEIFDAINHKDLAKVRELIDQDENQAGLTNPQGNTPLHVALLSGNDEISRFLIARGADIGKQNAVGNTPLHIAAQYNRKEIAELLISRGADLESKTLSGLTPLNLLTLMTDHYEMAKLLIEKGADVNTMAKNGNSPLSCAAHAGSVKIIDLLLDQNATYDNSNGNAMNLLGLSAGIGASRLFKYISDKEGESIFVNDADNRRLMRNALNGGSLEIVKLLQAKNIPVDVSKSIAGTTPLHNIAGNANSVDMIEFLVKNGADINARTNDGRSAYNIAESSGNKEAASLLLKLGANPEPRRFPVLTGPYLGQTPPGDVPVRFAPGIVSPDHSTIAVSPDGTEIYWNSGSNIMMTRIKDGKWTQPEIAPFSGTGNLNYYDDVPFVSPDNKRLFFMSMRPIGLSNVNKENIWYMDRTETGWSEPIPVSEEINAMGLHWQISVSNNGTLFFKGRSVEANTIFYSRWVNGKYEKPQKLGIDGQSPFIAPDESYIIFAKLVNNRMAIPCISFRSKDGIWQEPIQLDTYIGNGVCCIVTPDGKYIFNGSLWASADFIEELRKSEPKKGEPGK